MCGLDYENSENAFHGFRYMDKFDILFSESFYTGEWFEGVDQERILEAVICPAVYLKAIIHAVGPDFGVTPTAFKELFEAYYNSLKVLMDNGYHRKNFFKESAF